MDNTTIKNYMSWQKCNSVPVVNSKFKTNTSNDSIDGIKTLDFSVAAGLEYELKNGVIFQGRYTLGLTNVGGTLVPENDRAFNSAIQFSVGYLF